MTEGLKYTGKSRGMSTNGLRPLMDPTVVQPSAPLHIEAFVVDVGAACDRLIL